jgi:hypothetical protein
MQWLRRDGRIKLQRIWWMQVILWMPTELNSIKICTLKGYADKSTESFGFYCNTLFNHLTRIPLAKDVAGKQTISTRLRTPFKKQVSELTPCTWALLEKPPVAQPVKNFPTFYGTRRFITVFTRACHWSLTSKLKLNSVVLVRKRTIPTERPQPVGEVSANFSW